MLEVTLDGPVRVLRLAHGKASALDVELLEALEAALRAALAGPERALVLTGTGKIFSAGVDLPRVLREGSAYLERFLPLLDRVCLALYAFDRPVIGAINGHAIAGGCVIACACDRRVSHAAARFGVPELKVGVPFPLPALELARAPLLPGEVERLLLHGEQIDGTEARRVGWVDELVEPGAVLARAVELARELGALPPRAFALNKRMLRRAVLERIERELPRCAERVLEQWCAPATRAAIERFVQATLPREGTRVEKSSGS
jgi:enoyl-CoA hydratase